MTQPAPASNELRQRAATVQVGTLLIQCGNGTGLDVAFTIRQGQAQSRGGMKPRANTCDLKIYNLNQDHQKQLEQTKTPATTPMSANPQSGAKIVPCVISAGYVGRQSVVFSGELRAAHTVTDGPTAITELSTGDGDQALGQRRLSISLPPGGSAAAGLRAILKALGVGQGNLGKALTLLQSKPLAGQLFSRGVVLKGSAAEIMTDFCRSAGLEWRIQNGQFQVQDLGKPLDGQAILVDSAHGMIGSPTVDTRGVLSFVMLMVPDLKPGVKVSVNAKHVKGGFRVIGVEWSGGTKEDEWYAKVEALKY